MFQAASTLPLVADERGNGAFERAGAVAQFADDPQLDSVIEGRHRQSEADPVDENGDALEFGEKLSVSLTPAGTADAQDLAPSMDPVDIAANGESATLDLTVRENEEVNPETLVLDAEVAGERAYGRKTRATCRWPSRTPPGGSSRRGPTSP